MWITLWQYIYLIKNYVFFFVLCDTKGESKINIFLVFAIARQ